MIPLFRPSCTDLEVRYVSEALRSGWWDLGPRAAEFEEKFAAHAGAAHAVALSSGTAALQLVCEALGAAGGEVIVPALTFVSTALAPLHAGARVVFADVDDATLCLDWDDVTRRMTPRTRAVIPVWYGGTVTPAPADVLSMLGAEVVEDCAHAAGSLRAGRQGVAACWSFQTKKNLATGDGGMVTTDDGALAALLRELRWCGISRSTWDRDTARYGWEYDITRAGHKAHMNDLTAALGLAQLERLPEMNEARKMLVLRYLDALAGLDWLRLPHWRDDSSWHLFYVRVDAGRRDSLVKHLLANGVSAGVHYKPLNQFPVFGAHEPLPVTDRVWRELVTLPLFPDMTDAEHAQVVAAVRSFA